MGFYFRVKLMGSLKFYLQEIILTGIGNLFV